MTNPAPNDDLDMHRMLSEEFERTLASVASDLRLMADAIERVTSPAPHQSNPGFGPLAGAVVSDVMNMLPNLGLSRVVNVAHQADTSLLRTRATHRD